MNHRRIPAALLFPLLIEVADRLRQYFDKHLRGKDVVISSEPIKQGER